MKLDGMATYGRDDEVDVVVIGTGAGGAPLLAKLAQAGCRVVALEAGQNATPGLYPADEIVSAELYWLDERLAAGDGPQAFGANNSGTGVGGSMLHWGAFVPRADPRDLRIGSEFATGADWPLTLAELEPHYREIEAFIGVSGPGLYPWDPSRRYPLPPIAHGGPAGAADPDVIDVVDRSERGERSAISAGGATGEDVAGVGEGVVESQAPAHAVEVADDEVDRLTGRLAAWQRRATSWRKGVRHWKG